MSAPVDRCMGLRLRVSSSPPTEPFFRKRRAREVGVGKGLNVKGKRGAQRKICRV